MKKGTKREGGSGEGRQSEEDAERITQIRGKEGRYLQIEERRMGRKHERKGKRYWAPSRVNDCTMRVQSEFIWAVNSHSTNMHCIPTVLVLEWIPLR